MKEGADSLEEGVPGNLACMGCGYNLRTMRVAGVCPECGVGVGASVAYAKEAGRVDLKAVRRGAIVIVGVLVIDVGYGIIGALFFGDWLPYEARLLMWLAEKSVIAVVLFTAIRTLFGGIYVRGGWRWLRLVCLLYPVLVWCQVFGWTVINTPFYVNWHDDRLWESVALEITNVILSLYAIGPLLAAFLFTKRVAREVDRKWLERLSTVVFLVSASLSLFGALYLFIEGIANLGFLMSKPSGFLYVCQALWRSRGFQTAGGVAAGGLSLILTGFWLTVAIVAWREVVKREAG